jgi:hypothetical protein
MRQLAREPSLFAREGGPPFPSAAQSAAPRRTPSTSERTAMAMITVRQVKAARALLDWSREDLADSAGISYRTVARRDAIFAAFRVAGVDRRAIGRATEARGEVIGRRRRS